MAEHLFKPGQSGNPSGRPTGAEEKIKKELRVALKSFVESKLPELETLWTQLSPKDKIRLLDCVLPYTMHRLKESTLKIESLPEHQIDDIIQKLINGEYEPE